MNRDSAPVFVLSAHDRPGGDPVYHSMALLSARALRRHTQAKIILWSNDATWADRLRALPWCPFSTLHLAPEARHPKTQKLQAIAASGTLHDKICYLDADTIPLADIGQVFRFGGFDVAGVPAPWREDIADIDLAVAREGRRRWQLNSGVLFLRMPGFAPVLAKWQEDFAARLPDYAARPAEIRDQVSLQHACMALQPDMWRLPANYNFRVPLGGALSGACFVVHGLLDLGLEALYADFDAPALLDAMIDRVAVINSSPRSHVFVLPRGPVNDMTFRRPARG